MKSILRAAIVVTAMLSAGAADAQGQSGDTERRLSQSAGQDPAAVSAGRRCGCRRTIAGAETVGEYRAEFLRRKSRRRGRKYRRGHGSGNAAGRLHDPAHQFELSDQSGSAEGALRSGRRLRADHHHQRLAEYSRSPSGPAGEVRQGSDRSGEEGAGQAQLRVRRRRLDAASAGRNVQAGLRSRHGACPVRRRRPRAAIGGRRSHADRVCGAAARHPAGQGWKPARTRHCRSRSGRPSCRTCRP